jgi:RNA polymerase sigma-70 factor (ECF subfamily)
MSGTIKIKKIITNGFATFIYSGFEQIKRKKRTVVVRWGVGSDRRRGGVMENYLHLVKAARRGDSDAFAELYGQIYRDMYRFALYTLRNTADAEDAVSDAVTDAFVSIKKLRTEEAFKGWMFRILTNKCMDKLREYRRKNFELNEEITNLPVQASLEEGAVVRKIFFELSEEERLIIGMHLFCGYKSREIAEILHMNENTVRSKESRGLKKMAIELESQEG